MSSVIGVLLEFDSETGKASLTFSLNGQSLGQAFSPMPPGKYYPLLSLASNMGAPTPN